MNKVLLDTDIYSEIIKAVNPIVTQNAEIYYNYVGYYTIATITVTEITKGLLKASRHKQLKSFQESLDSDFLEILAFTTPIAKLTGNIYADLENVGMLIGLADCMLAATAICHNLVLVTGNTKHYQRIQNFGYSLQFDNWKL